MTPILSRRALRPLALVLPLALTLTACDSGGDDGPVDSNASVYATSNPTGADSDTVVRLSSDLTASQATFTGITSATSVQNVFVTGSGDGYLTVDLAGTLGGIVYVPSLCVENGDGCTNGGSTIGVGNRFIAGAATGLIAPKGIIEAEERLVVADNGAPGAIRVFARAATGNQAPAFTVTNITGATNVWDVTYNEGDDMLFVAGTNGVVLVYDDFFARGADATPTRTITPSDAAGVKISVNLHGIAYDADADVLVLSDVGAAMGDGSAGDGQIFTIDNASTAMGSVQPRLRIAGAATSLGNPVDVALSEDGDLFVAEKANDRVLRFDDVLTATGLVTTAANASFAVTKAESVSLANE